MAVGIEEAVSPNDEQMASPAETIPAISGIPRRKVEYTHFRCKISGKPIMNFSLRIIPTKNNNNAELMTEAELIHFLRIPEISGSKNYHNVIEHLKKFRGSPRIHICRKALYPKKAVLEWLEKETNLEK